MSKFINFIGMAKAAQGLKNTYLGLKLDARINMFIENEDWKSVVDFCDRGYKLTDKQLYNMMGMKVTVIHQDTIDKMYSLYNRQYRDDLFSSLARCLKVFNKVEGKFHHQHDTSSYPNVVNKLVTIHLKNLHAFNFILQYHPYKEFFREEKSFFNILSSTTDIASMAGLLAGQAGMHKYYPEEFVAYRNNSRIISQQYKELVAVMEAQVPNMKEYIQNVENSHKRAEFTAHLDEFSSILKPVEAVQIKALQKFSVKKLPEEAQKYILKINHIYTHIADEHHLDVNNLYGKRLPQLIDQYNKINPEYKKFLPEDPDKLLLESLAEIHNKLETILASQQQASLTQLKVTHRYLNSM